MKFHDGQEMTSADVKFTVRPALREVAGQVGLHRRSTRSSRPASYAVKFVTKEPFAGLLAALGGFWGFIISEAGIKKHGDLNKAAPRHWALHARGLEGRAADGPQEAPQLLQERGCPTSTRLILRVIPDEANIVAALRTGQIHHAFIEDNKNYNLLKDEKTLTGYRSSRLGYDYPQHQREPRRPLKDVRVRQAISLGGGPQRRCCAWPPPASAGSPRRPRAPMKQWQLPEEQWMRYYKPDVDKAKKLMADAGLAGGFTVKLHA